MVAVKPSGVRNKKKTKSPVLIVFLAKRKYLEVEVMSYIDCAIDYLYQDLEKVFEVN